MIKQLLPHALRALKEHRLTILFVDIGSRNGVFELRDLAGFVEAYGFEPNPHEYEKLVTGRTDETLMYQYASPRYSKLLYFPYALGNFCGKHEFYVTPSPGACGLLEPNLERLREIIWKGRRYQKNFADEVFADFERIEVDVKTLDAFAAEHGIRCLDYLKIDVEGSESEVLEGSRSLLPHVGVLKVETCFIPFRKGQKLFSHVDLLLREFGFDLLRYEIVPVQIGYKERTLPIEWIADKQVVDSYGQALSCDAIYVNRTIEDPDRVVAQALVLMEKNYLDEALHLLKTKTRVRDPLLFELLQTVQYGGGTRSQQWQKIGYRMVDKVVEAASFCVRGIRRCRSVLTKRGLPSTVEEPSLTT